MNLVSLERVTKRYAEKLLLDAVSFGVDDGDRIGLIGRNGAGKSTLLRLVAGVEEPDAGRVVHTSGLRVSMLAQEPRLDPAATAAAATGGTREAEAMLHRLGVVDPLVPVGALSGGQRRRVALAAALAADAGMDTVGAEHGLLILDEPTNHLDVDAIAWLEDRLFSRAGALVLVTHDRYLLDRVATRILELDGGRLQPHDGGYASYLEARVLRTEQAAAAEQRRQNRMRTELAWLRRGPKARTSKARYRVERAEDLIAAAPEPLPSEIAIELPSRRLGGKVVNLHNAGKQYDGRWVVRGVDLKLAPGARIGLVGRNGTGKTTLMGLMAGRVDPDEGKIVHGDTVVTGWYGQDPRELPPGERVLATVDAVARETSLTSGLRVGAADLLERFGFERPAQRGLVGELSGGERRRLELLLVLAEAPNVLFLDEPTNDLDLDTLAVLEDFLDTFGGAVVCATHDRYFLDRVCRDVLSVDGGHLRHHPGGWSAYRQWLAASEARPEPRPRRVAAPAPPPGPRKLTYKERRELERLERDLPAMETRRDELAAEVAAAGEDYQAAARAGQELTAVLQRLAAVEERWLELSEIGEA